MLVKWLFILGLSFLSSPVFGQKTVIQSDKAIRSFQMINDTLYYSNNDHLLVYKEGELKNKIYPGGYLLDFKVNYPRVISIANRYKQQVGTIRIFDLSKNEYSLVYKIKESSPILAYSLYSFKRDTLSLMVSFNNGRLKWYKSSGELINDIGFFSKIREIKQLNGYIFFCTDKGGLYKTNGKSTELVFKVSTRIIGFEINENFVYAYDDEGNFLAFNRKTKNLQKINICSAILIDFIRLREHIFVFGDWKGRIFTYDHNLDKIISIKQEHKGMILKLQRINDSEFLSSGRDGLIKHWKINSH